MATIVLSRPMPQAHPPTQPSLPAPAIAKPLPNSTALAKTQIGLSLPPPKVAKGTGTGTAPKEAAGAGGWIAEALREHEEHERSEQEVQRSEHGPATGIRTTPAGRPALPTAPACGASCRWPTREQQVLDRIDRARRRRPKVREERITMSHGAGGKGHAHADRGGLPRRLPQPAARAA